MWERFQVEIQLAGLVGVQDFVAGECELAGTILSFWVSVADASTYFLGEACILLPEACSEQSWPLAKERR